MNNFSPILNGIKRNKRLAKMSYKRMDNFLPKDTAYDEFVYFLSIELDNSQTDRECEERLYGRIF